MTILKIARMGHPILQTVAQEVEDPADPKIAAFVADMIETMHDANGTGLAAPQVHVPLRVVIYMVSPARDSAEGIGVPLTVLINPEIEPIGSETDVDWEGCLSLPGMMGEVERFTHIRYSAYDLKGNRIQREAKGFHARVVQHECDHLDGILYPYRIENMDRFGFSEELMKQAPSRLDETEDEQD
ncbi:peptide deformylase [Magnetovibrio blakemorei]|uniref:Peptide deformylase n=1 Tax=Magnetovibrio blakemorei TaxID=28181 RepID=A0A1E5Q9U0_9PROT|nr:peptide deformylase [Magnetovibrio blakemorei]OEJ68503.1 peptide deformylase [Magnetovibrio blakemorei]